MSDRITRTTLHKDSDEYVVRAYGRNGRLPEADYFTDDKDDAKRTAKLMECPLRKGDRVRPARCVTDPLLDAWNNEGRQPAKDRKRGWLDAKVAERGTVQSVVFNSTGALVVKVKVDGYESLSSSLPYRWDRVDATEKAVA